MAWILSFAGSCAVRINQVTFFILTYVFTEGQGDRMGE